MKTLVLSIAVAAAAAALAAPSQATRRDDANHQRETYMGLAQARLFPPIVTVAQVRAARSAVWRCQHRAGIPPSKAGLDHRKLAAVGSRFRQWIVGSWGERLEECERTLAATVPATGDWRTAVRIVQRFFPGSEWWLIACSSSEGGHGRWVPNTQGSGAGGWMQYMEPTFWGDFRAALADLAARGIRAPPSASSWYSPLGQAIAAGWAYSHARPSGKWTGGSC